MNKEQALIIAMRENDYDYESAESDYNCDYLTINTGRDGIDYAWYYTGNREWVFDLNGRELSKVEIEELL